MARSSAVEVTTFSEARANLRAYMDMAGEDRLPVVITRRKREPVVMVSLSEWNALNETDYLLSTPTNAERLRAGIAAADRGEAVERDLIDA